MRILLAPDKFKGTLSAQQVCAALRAGIHRFDATIEVLEHPLADGGDGSLGILSEFLALKKQKITVQDPLGRPVQAAYFRIAATAFIELAAASGYVLLEDKERNPRLTSTFGTGQMLGNALEQGCTEAYLFLGGSATNDGGIGLASAIGFDFLDKNGKSLKPIGDSLTHLHEIDASGCTFDFSKIRITALCDVANPLYAPQGAAYIYAPQKGASPEDVQDLDEGLRNLAAVVQRDLGVDLQRIKGGGAAGGIAAGLVGFCNATLVEGTKTIMELTGFEEKAKKVDWIFSGEGQLDASTLEGKVASEVIAWAHQNAKKSALFVGRNALSDRVLEELPCAHIAAVMDVAPSMTAAMQDGERYLEELAYSFCATA